MGFFKATKVFGRPIRKVKAAASTGVLVIAVRWVLSQFGADIPNEGVRAIAEAIQTTLQLGGEVWAPIIAAYFVRSDVRDADVIPR